MKKFIHHLHEGLVDVKYGPLTQEDESKIDLSDKFITHFKKTGILERYKKHKMPSAQQTHQELKELQTIMADATDDDLKFALNAEVDEKEMYRKFAKSIGLHLSSHFIDDIFNQTDPILFYLKKHYDRARPEQFANANNIPFQVEISSNAMHPACPSGHALDSYLMEYVLTKLSPSNSIQIKEFCKKMRESRNNVGLHYMSDNEMSRMLAKDIISSGLLKFPGENI